MPITLSDKYSPIEFEQYMKNHPCSVRFSLIDKRVLIGEVDKPFDQYQLYEKDTDQFMEYLVIAHDTAAEYTATIKSIRARNT